MRPPPPDAEPLVQEARLALLQPLLDAAREAGYVAVEIEAPVEFIPTCGYRWLTTIRGVCAPGTDPRGLGSVSIQPIWPAIWGIVARLVGPYACGSGHQVQAQTNALPPGHYTLQEERP